MFGLLVSSVVPQKHLQSTPNFHSHDFCRSQEAVAICTFLGFRTFSAFEQKVLQLLLSHFHVSRRSVEQELVLFCCVPRVLLKNLGFALSPIQKVLQGSYSTSPDFRQRPTGATDLRSCRREHGCHPKRWTRTLSWCLGLKLSLTLS